MTTTLEQLYEQLPTIECRRSCQDTCRDIPLLAEEHDRTRLPLVMDGACPKLIDPGLCGIHENRPLMCRLWGVVENMPCPHGCKPTRMLTVIEAAAVITEAVRIGGGWVND